MTKGKIKNRIFRLIKIDIAVIAAGICYYCFICFTQISIPCIFRLITGLKCPLCGATTLAVSLFRLNIYDAFMSNPVLFVVSPFIIAVWHIRYIQTDKAIKMSRKNEMIILIALIIYATIRNIYGF